jgi:predicted ATPase
MLTYFRVENYKCLETVEFPLTPIHVLIGPNDSGKTSVLEAMLAYMRNISLPFQICNTLEGDWRGNELLFHGAKPDSGVLLLAKGDSDFAVTTSDIPPYYIVGYGFSFRFLAGRACTVVQQVRVFSIVTPKPGLPTEKKIDVKLTGDASYAMSALARAQQRDPDRELSLPRGFQGQAYLYRFDPKVLAAPATPAVLRKFRMDTDGFGLATLLDDIVGHSPELFIKLRDEFCQFFPQFKAVGVETAEAYDRTYNPNLPHATTVGDMTRRQGNGKEVFFTTKWGKQVRAAQASEGVLLFLAFLALVHLPPPYRPKLILLEDVERGVYPKKLEELVNALKAWVSANAGEDAPQLVLTTHSPYVISFFDPEQVTFMSRAKDGGVRARPLRDAQNIDERRAGGFYLGELWYNLTEEELFGDAQA